MDLLSVDRVVLFLQQAGSDGELSQADGLGSAGSSSTLASSVIEVEAARTEPSGTPQLRPNQEQEEEDEEELTPLIPPPTLSITEEILEFINQSRAREGLSAILTGTTDHVLDQPKESPPPPIQTNFTCPLPPVACPSSPEQRPTMHQEQEPAETQNDSTFQSPTGGLGEESGLENERTTNKVQEIQDDASEVAKGVEVGEEAGGDVFGEEEDEKTKAEGEIIIHASDLHRVLSAEEERMSCESPEEEGISETTTSPPIPDATQRGKPRGSHLTKRDQKIIEKIRSYYEAAAEAGEEEAEEAKEQEEEEEGDEGGDGASQRRRSSFSQIPSGLVKESVSRFDVSSHQGEPEDERCDCETAEGIDRKSDPEISGFTQLSAEAGDDVQAEEPIGCLDFEGQTSPEIQDEVTPNRVNPQPSPNRPVEEEAEILVQIGKVCGRPSEEVLEEEQTSGVATGETGEEPSTTKQDKCTDEPIKTSAENPVVMNGHEQNPTGRAEPNGSHKEPATPLPTAEQCQNTEANTQSTWTRTKHRDLQRTNGNLEGLPSQIKVGRWSSPSRIVTANRVLFEGMGSDVAGIGLFETGPVVDPMLMENSERILSKVQTLARMYSAKASTMKVPLHQKRASNVWNQSRGSGRLPGYSTQIQTEGHSIQFPTQYRQQTEYQEEVSQAETHSDTKCGTQTHPETKVQSQTATRQQSQIQTKSQRRSQTHHQSQNQTKSYSRYQTQTTSQENRTIQEEKTMNGAESLTNESQQAAASSDPDPPPFGNMFVNEQPTPHRQTNGVTLSRPRDFISALAQERDCRLTDSFQTSTSPGESPPRHHFQASSPPTSTMSPDCRDPELTDFCCDSSTARGGVLDPNGESCSGDQERDRSEPSPSAHSKAPWEFSRDGKDLQDLQRDDPECNSSIGQTCNEDVFAADGEASRAEPVPSPAESDRSTAPDPVKSGSNGSSSQTRMLLHGSSVIFTDESSYCHASSGEHLSRHATFDPPEGHHGATAPSPRVSARGSHPADRLLTFNGRRPKDLQDAPGSLALSDSREPDHRDSRPSSRPSTENLLERPTPAVAPPGPDADPSAFRPCLRHRSPSPVRARPPSSSSTSVRAPPCSSPFKVVPASYPSPASAEDASLNVVSRALPCFSPTPSPGRGSSSGRSSSMRAGPPSSPTPASTLRSSPIASSSTFTRSLAASCISQSISQSIAKKNHALQQAPPTIQSPSPMPSLPPSHLRRRSPSPQLQGSDTPAYTQLGCPKDGYQHPRGPLSSLWSSCPAQPLMPLAPPSLSQRSPSPSMTHHQPYSPSPRPSFLHSKSNSNANNKNNNNNNNNVSYVAAANTAMGNKLLANGSSNAAVIQQSADPLWSGSHNRVARPFSASEPSSRVQSPSSPSPTPPSFTHLCPLTPQHNYTSPMANKPPHPRGSTRAGGANSHNPLGLTLELPTRSSSCLSPWILSPPPIGVPLNAWTNNIAAPQPRHPKYPSSSPSASFPSSRGSQTLENASFPSQTLRRSQSSNMADRPPSPARSHPGGARRSWAEGAGGRGLFDRQESCPTSPRSGWSSYAGSPSCLSPRAGLRSPLLLPSRLTPGAGALGGQHFTSVPWPDVRELSNKYSVSEGLDSTSSSFFCPPPSLSHSLLSSPVSSDSQAAWADPEIQEGNCRSQLICAYVARPTSSCPLRSTSPPPPPSHYQSATPPAPSIPSPSPRCASPLPFDVSPPTKQGNQKTSYATTVNLQIAGSGRITSFSTAQVSLTQTLQAGAAGPGPGPGPGQSTRRISINGLSHIPSTLSQNCNRM
ncbi:mucin-5AC [Clinocottus analis]|uniref:mucin-5AC n=1 Tax=Clinocottus analis TaxID=304258 RepID=UPI0035BFA4C5